MVDKGFLHLLILIISSQLMDRLYIEMFSNLKTEEKGSQTKLEKKFDLVGFFVSQKKNLFVYL